MKIQITKCYLVQVLDQDDNEVACEYVFGDKEDAKQAGKRLKEEAKDNGKKIYRGTKKSLIKISG